MAKRKERRQGRLRQALLCDEIRREDNGKLIYIGSYTDAIIASQRPTLMTLNLALLFELYQGGEHEVDLRIEAPGLTAEATLQSPAGTPARYSFGTVAPFPCMLLEESEIAFSWRIDKGEWSAPLCWAIQIAPNAPSLPPEQVKELAQQFREIASAMGIKLSPTAEALH